MSLFSFLHDIHGFNWINFIWEAILSSSEIQFRINKDRWFERIHILQG